MEAKVPFQQKLDNVWWSNTPKVHMGPTTKTLFTKANKLLVRINPTRIFEALRDIRPSTVVAESDTKDVFGKEVVVEQAMNKVSGMKIPMKHQFEKQFTSEYMSRICPWALNYKCGGADYVELFKDIQSFANMSTKEQEAHINER